METTIEWRKMQVVKGKFSLAIDATRVAQVLDVLHMHGAQHLIPIDGMDKIKVQDILDGKLEEYGKISISREVKVVVMSFQYTPSDVLTM